MELTKNFARSYKCAEILKEFVPSLYSSFEDIKKYEPMLEVIVPPSSRRRGQAICLFYLNNLYKILSGKEGVWVTYSENESVAKLTRTLPDGSIERQVCYMSFDATNRKIEYIGAGELSPEGNIMPYDNTVRKGSIVFLALLGFMMPLIQDTIIMASEPLTNLYNKDWWDENGSKEQVYKLIALSSSIYYLINEGISHCNDTTKEIVVSVPVMTFPKEKLRERYSTFIGTDDTVETPVPAVSKKRGRPRKTPVAPIFKGLWSILTKKLTKYEESLIPHMPDSYERPAWVETICRDVKESEIFPQKFRNILLVGEAGTGKSQGSSAIAEGLGLPRVHLTCFPEMDMVSLIGSHYPNEEGGFTFQKSPLIEALENGWLCEIQEPTILKRPEVLVGLNSLLETGEDASVQLANGEVIKRHPDAVIVMTTNGNYVGCNEVQESVLSRIDLKYTIPNPSTTVMVERTVKQTGFSDRTILTKMVKTVEKINSFCISEDITGGVCGPRELFDWAKKTMILANRENGGIIDENAVVKAAFSTMLSKVSQNADDYEAVIMGVFNDAYGISIVDAAAKAYERGEI